MMEHAGTAAAAHVIASPTSPPPPRHHRARPGDLDVEKRRALLIGMARTDPRIKSGDGHDEGEVAGMTWIRVTSS
ncbi:hypothetical protein J4G37_06040 [Microvirga sp. 3-52]|nr:hypothetical protein [Microvirga sp. 3-52]